MQSKAQTQVNFFQIETATKSILAHVLEKLNQRLNHCVGFQAEDEFSRIMSTQFLEKQKNHFLDFQEQYERYWNTLSVFGFDSARYEITFFKSFSLPVIVSERDIEPRVIKETSQILLFKFGIVQLIHISKLSRRCC